MCTRYDPCLTETDRVIDVQNQLKDKEIVFIDARPPRIIVVNSTILTELKEVGILQPKDSFFDYDRIMFRLMVNPSRSVRNVILEERSRVFQKRPILGVQIRVAGLLADTKESVSFIDEEALKNIPDLILSTIQTFGFNRTLNGIYLSTDSKIVENLLQDTIGGKYPILKTDLFRRGHSTGSPKEDVIKRALVDMYMLAECDGLLTTQGSGFGGIAHALSQSRLRAIIPVHRKKVIVPRRRHKSFVCFHTLE